MKVTTASYYSENPTLWEEQCRNECEVFDQCGGTFTAPCHCVKRGKERYDCANCAIICRERKAPPTRIYPEDTFKSQISSGKAIEDVLISQQLPNIPFPLFIPIRTNGLEKLTKRPYIGITIDQIIRVAKRPKIQNKISSKGKANKFLNASRGTNFIAVLNNIDTFLEALWRMPDRDRFYEALRRIGIEYITGPTFSINAETKKHPASHNIAMLMRHHYMIQEIQNHGLTPIPNIYWRSEIDIEKWIDWIHKKSIHLIARDFSFASKTSGTPYVMDRFIEMLKSIRSPLHVFITGVGIVHARYLVREFISLDGHTCTIISSDPIMNGLLGGKKLDATTLTYRSAPNMSRSQIAFINFEIFEKILLEQQEEYDSRQLKLF